MAKKFYTDINLKKNELQNAAIENLAAAPSDPVLGQVYFNTTDNEIYVCVDADAPTWESMGGDIESVTAGAGLTGGGTDGAVTLDIGQGTGITVNADEIKLKNADSLTDDTVVKWDDTNGQLVDTVITDNGTNVGINNTSPSVELDVTGDTKFSGNSELLNGNYITKSLPSFSMGAGGVNDEYLVICKQVVAIPSEEELEEGETQADYYQDATGVTGRIYFSRGSAGSFNNNGYIDIVAQVSKDSGNVNNFDLSEFRIVGDSLFFTQLEEIDIDGVKYLALKARPSGGGSVNHFFFVGNLSDDGTDTKILTKVRASDGTVTVTEPQPSGFPVKPYITQKENGYLGINKVDPSYWLDVSADNVRFGNIVVGRGGSDQEDNIAIGAGAMTANAGSGSLAIGTNALNVSTGAANTGVGDDVLKFSANASYATSVGTAAGMRDNATQNTFIGSYTGPYYTELTGGYNTMLGSQAGIQMNGAADKNTGIGNGALYNLTTGSDNTTLGQASGSGITTGTGNIMIGIGNNGVTTGSYNVVIGKITGLTADLSNTIILADGESNERMRITSAGRVGIGTTSPGTELHVKASGWSEVRIDGGSGASLEYFSGNNRLADIYATTSKNLIFRTNGSTEQMRIQSNGRVGIGTANPQKELHVAGDILISDDANDVNLFLGTLNFGLKLDYDDSKLSLRTNFADRLTIDLNGNVGIGTTSPSDKLDVHGIIAIDSAALIDKDGNKVIIGDIDGADDIGFLDLNTADASTRVFLDDSGHVGINTDNPLVDLHVVGELLGNTDGDSLTHVTIEGQRHHLDIKEIRTATLEEQDWKSTTLKLQLRVDSTNHQSIDFVSDDSFQEHIDILTGNQVFNTRFTADGKVGIGTDSPIAKLSVLSASTGYSSDSQIKLSDGSTSYYGGLSFDDAGSTRLSVRNSYDGTGSIVGFGFGGSSDKVQVINGTGLIVNEGKLLIGTTSSIHGSADLQIVGTTGNYARIAMKDSDGTNQIAFIDEISGSLNFTSQNGTSNGTIKLIGFDGTTSTTRMIIDADGNVGIGTTSPNALLEISRGDSGQTTAVAGGDNLILSDSSNGGMSIFTPSTALGSIFFGDESDSDVGWIRYNHTNDYMLIGTGGGTRVTIKNNGLINLAAYGAGYLKSDASGNITVDSDTIEDTLDSVTTRGNTTTNNITVGNITSTSGVVTMGQNKIDGSSDNLKIMSDSESVSGSSTIEFSVDGSEKMRITHTGNVGIGTTSPSTTLHSYSTQASPILAERNIANGNVSIWFKDQTSSWYAGKASNGNFGISRSANLGASTVFNITSSDNVGIGLSSPSYKLEVAGGGDNVIAGFSSTDNRASILIQDNDTASYIGSEGGLLYFNRGTGNGIASAPSNGMVIDSSGNVGIGTASPSEKLHVSGNVRIEGDLTVNGSYTQIDTDVNTTEQWNVTNDGTGPAVTINQTGSQDIMDVQDDGTSVFYIEDGGNVGIGTTDPATNVDVKSDANPTIRITSGKDGTWTADEEIGSIEFYSSDTSGVGAGVRSAIRSLAYDNFGSRSELTFSTTGSAGDTENMRITSYGKLKLNQYGSNSFTGTAAYALAVDSSGNVIETTVQSSPAGIDGTGTVGYLTKWSTTDTISDSVIYQTDSKILIGSTTTAFSDKLYVNGDAYATGGWRVGSAATYVGKVTNGSGALTLESDGNRDIKFGSSTNGTKMYIDTSSGNVGIGTTSPSDKLHIQGLTANIRLVDTSYKSATAGQTAPKITFHLGGNSSEQSPSIAEIRTFDDYVSGGAFEGSMAFYTMNGSIQERMRITSGGNVGIGTTSPNSFGFLERVLHISAGSASSTTLQQAGLVIQGSSDADDAVDFGYLAFTNYQSTLANDRVAEIRALRGGTVDKGELTFLTADGSTVAERMRLGSSGNFGINTASPSQKLDVNGTALIRNTIYLGDDIQHWGDGGTGMFFGTDTISFKNDGGSTRIHLKSGGNVGIGTTSPSASLHVASTTNDYVAKFSHSTATGYAPGSILLEAGQSNSRGQGLFHYNTEADEIWFTGVPYNSQSQKWIVANKYNTSLDLSVAQLDHALFTIDSNNGNVGIGTTSPSKKLHVDQGYIKVQSPNVGGVIPPSLQIGQVVNAYQAGIASNGHATVTAASNVYLRTGGSQYALTALANGNVGIGTTSPGSKLTVAGRVDFQNDLRLRGTDSAANQGVVRFYVNSSNKLHIDTANDGNNLFVIDSSGNVGIGTESPSEKLEVDGNVKADNFIGGKDAGIYTFSDTVDASSSEDIFSISNEHGSQAFRVTFVCSTDNYSVAKTYEVVHQFGVDPVFFKVVDTGAYSGHDFDASFATEAGGAAENNKKIICTITNNSTTINADIVTTVFLGGSPTTITVTAL